MSACAVLVAALAVQPALGRDGKGKGQGKDDAAAVTAAAPASSGPPTPAATTTTRASARSSNAGRRSTRQTAAPAPAPAPAPLVVAQDPVPAPAPPPANPPTTVPPGTATPEDGATGAAPPTTPAPAPSEAPSTPPPPPPPGAEPPSRTPAAAEAAAAPAPTTPPNAVGAADREAVVSNAPLLTSQPPDAPADAQQLAPPADAAQTATDAPTASALNRQAGTGQAPGAGTGQAQARGITRLLPVTNATTGGTAASTALGAPLNNAATTGITGIGVRSAGDSLTSLPQPSASGNVPALGAPQSFGSRVSSAVVNVVPTLMWIALGALGLLVMLLGAHTVLQAARTRRLQRHREKLMEDIGLLQAALLPAVPARMGALLTTVAYRPADGPAAGGDFYDAFALPDGKVGLLLGDVSGHGRQALAKTTLVRFTVRAHLEAGMSPREAISIAGRSLDGRLSDDFATVLAAIHDPATGTLTYSSAGHPPPLVLGPSAHAPITASSAPPIGAGFPTGQRQTIVPMPEGTTVAVYSDGLLEARIEGQPLGAERLADWLSELGPEASAKQLLDLVVQRADRVPDDLAAVVLHAAPGATAPAARVEQLKLDVLDVEGPDLEGFLKAAGVAPSERAVAGRRVSEQLAITGGVIVEVRAGEHPTVSVYAIGDRPAATRQSTPAR
jgi:hypothetical protein